MTAPASSTGVSRESHRYAVAKLNRALCRGLGPGFSVRIHEPVVVPGWSGSEPLEIDVAVLWDKFYRPVPTTNDALAFVEVSDETYAEDRVQRIPLYVRCGVPAWIVNLPERVIEFYGEPADLDRPHGTIFTEFDAIEILGARIPVAFLLDVIAKR